MPSLLPVLVPPAAARLLLSPDAELSIPEAPPIGEMGRLLLVLLPPNMLPVRERLLSKNG